MYVLSYRRYSRHPVPGEMEVLAAPRLDTPLWHEAQVLRLSSGCTSSFIMRFRGLLCGRQSPGRRHMQRCRDIHHRTSPSGPVPDTFKYRRWAVAMSESLPKCSPLRVSSPCSAASWLRLRRWFMRDICQSSNYGNSRSRPLNASSSAAVPRWRSLRLV